MRGASKTYSEGGEEECQNVRKKGGEHSPNGNNLHVHASAETAKERGAKGGEIGCLQA